MLKYRNVSGKDPLKRLLLGIVVLILSMIAAVSTACNEEDISASRPTVTPAPAYETIAPTSYSTPNPTPTATSTPAPTPTPTSTPTPSPTPASIPAPTPILPVEKPAEILIRENVGYATDDGIAVRASPTSSSQLLGTLKYREEVKILGQVEGESWIPSSREWAGKWFELKDGGFVYFTFIYVPKEREASPFVSGEKKVEVDRGKNTLYAFIDGNLVYQAPVGIGQPWTPTPLGEFNVWTKVVNETMSGADYSISQVLYTQYFENGYALHFNWWSPIDAFGNYPTSHGCVSLRLHDAQWMWFFGFSEMSVRIYE